MPFASVAKKNQQNVMIVQQELFHNLVHLLVLNVQLDIILYQVMQHVLNVLLVLILQKVLINVRYA